MKIIILIFFSLITLHAEAWNFFGYGSFEECVSDEMKGRERNQLSIVEDGCRAKFPILKNLINKNNNGIVKCHGSDGNINNFSINGNKIVTYFGEFDVTNRTNQVINAENSKNTIINEWGVGARMTINLHTGSGLIYSKKNQYLQWTFACNE